MAEHGRWLTGRLKILTTVILLCTRTYDTDSDSSLNFEFSGGKIFEIRLTGQKLQLFTVSPFLNMSHCSNPSSRT